MISAFNQLYAMKIQYSNVRVLVLDVVKSVLDQKFQKLANYQFDSVCGNFATQFWMSEKL